DLLGADSVLGLEVSSKSLEVARRTNHHGGARFLQVNEYEPCGEIDLAYCNGVFHHIEVERRGATVNYIYRSLKPGGLFSLWENNPWNPAMRYAMSNCPFDENAITLNTFQARALVREGGFQVLRTDFMFIFPKALRWLRRLEPPLSRLPLGAQYQILCRKC
ncbi:MAG: class I SAM-dependent methyltransferase, partial [Acidobacteriota bacterium]|nr:class I SAM-dependent methyltransferase [Acidobacteriota bacterium]